MGNCHGNDDDIIRVKPHVVSNYQSESTKRSSKKQERRDKATPQPSKIRFEPVHHAESEKEIAQTQKSSMLLNGKNKVQPQAKESQDFKQKQQVKKGNELLCQAMNNFNKLPYFTFLDLESSINKVIEIYEEVLQNANDKDVKQLSDPIKLSKIYKNIGVCYQRLIQNFQPSDFVTDKSKYINDINKLVKFIEKFIQSQNKALYYGENHQDASWNIKIIQNSVFLFENKFLKNIFLNLILDQKIQVYQQMLNQISNLNLDLQRRVAWTLGKLYFKKSVSYFDKKDHNQHTHCLAQRNIESARQNFLKYQEITEKLAQFTKKTQYNYMTKNNFKSNNKLQENLKRVSHQQILIQCWNEMKIGEDQFDKAVFNKEDLDIDLIYTSIDSFTRAISLSFEVDAEVEAISLAHLGKAFYKGLQKDVKAKKFYLEAVVILETLKPKVFTKENWYKLLLKHMNEIQTEQNRKEREARSKDEESLRKELKKELDDIKKYQKQGARKFLEFISDNYASYQNQKVEFEETDLTEAQLRKTILKTCKCYHSDKSANSGFDQKQIFLREQIMRVLTRFMNEMKGF